MQWCGASPGRGLRGKHAFGWGAGRGWEQGYLPFGSINLLPDLLFASDTPTGDNPACFCWGILILQRGPALGHHMFEFEFWLSWACLVTMKDCFWEGAAHFSFVRVVVGMSRGARQPWPGWLSGLSPALYFSIRLRRRCTHACAMRGLCLALLPIRLSFRPPAFASVSSLGCFDIRSLTLDRAFGTINAFQSFLPICVNAFRPRLLRRWWPSTGRADSCKGVPLGVAGLVFFPSVSW
jgi:hypothetical protein